MIIVLYMVPLQQHPKHTQIYPCCWLVLPFHLGHKWTSYILWNYLIPEFIASFHDIVDMQEVDSRDNGI